jgi:HD-GYP domain-containing protein (c-di-GMP phosphodiesterase class II)
MKGIFMNLKETGLLHISRENPIEHVSLKGMDLALLASGDGTEIIHHRLQQGSRWALIPAEGWNALEYLFVLSGKLIWNSPNGTVSVKAGDSISAIPVKKEAYFIAEVETEFLYVSSQPVFHHYSLVVKEMMDLAVSVEQKDGYTADHCQRIMKLSRMLGERMGLNSSELIALNFGSFLHDVGKVKVPSEILGKPSALTNEEWMIMKNHTIFGRQLLEETKLHNLLQAAFIVEQHHERLDGKGYPYGLSSDKISIGGAIVAVVDSYDAMTTDRVYRKGRPKEEALFEIENGKGSMYHPDVVEAFLSISNIID